MFTFSGKRVLLISPEGWGKSFLSKHHYAITLTRAGAEVWFLASGKGEAFRPAGIDGLTVLFHEGARGLRHAPRFLAHRIMRREARQIEAMAGGKFDVVWSFDSSRLFDLSVFEGAFRIYHMVDERNDFNLPLIAASSDVCFAVTSGMVSRLKEFNANCYFIQHGVTPVEEVTAILPEGRNAVRALYAGNLRMQFLDWELIGKVIREFPGVDFYFVGSTGGGNMNPGDWPVHPVMQHLRDHPNVILTGEVDHITLQAYMKQSDILLLMYDSRRFPDEVANSHKILSYLSTGKVIVATHTREYEGTGLLEMAQDHESFLAKFRAVTSNTEAYNLPEHMKARMQYASDNTYERQLQRIISIISQRSS